MVWKWRGKKYLQSLSLNKDFMGTYEMRHKIWQQNTAHYQGIVYTNGKDWTTVGPMKI